MQFVKYIKKNYRAITLGSYLLPILLSVIVSLSHVVTFWEIANPAGWSIFLSIAIEVAVLSSIAASRISNWAWFPFSVVTFVQIIGNIFYSYTNISLTDPLFKSWVELSDPLFNFIGFGTDGDLIVHKRIVATFLGGTIPLISILFFHFFIRETRMNPIDLSSEAVTDELPMPNINPPIVITEPETVITEPVDVSTEPETVITEPEVVIPLMQDIVLPANDSSQPGPIIETLLDPIPVTDINELHTVYPNMPTVDVPNIEVEAFTAPAEQDTVEDDEKKK